MVRWHSQNAQDFQRVKRIGFIHYMQVIILLWPIIHFKLPFKTYPFQKILSVNPRPVTSLYLYTLALHPHLRFPFDLLLYHTIYPPAQLETFVPFLALLSPSLSPGSAKSHQFYLRVSWPVLITDNLLLYLTHTSPHTGLALPQSPSSASEQGFKHVSQILPTMCGTQAVPLVFTSPSLASALTALPCSLLSLPRGGNA